MCNRRQHMRLSLSLTSILSHSIQQQASRPRVMSIDRKTGTLRYRAQRNDGNRTSRKNRTAREKKSVWSARLMRSVCKPRAPDTSACHVSNHEQGKTGWPRRKGQKMMYTTTEIQLPSTNNRSLKEVSLSTWPTRHSLCQQQESHKTVACVISRLLVYFACPGTQVQFWDTIAGMRH